jgi:hypothetical protein
MTGEDGDWIAAWQPMIAAVGRDFAPAVPPPWGERIDHSVIARYIEPLELDCAIHCDKQVAQANGYRDIVVPYTALTTLAMPLMWRPGDPPLFTNDDRNARPDRSAISSPLTGLEPPTSHIFAVRWDMEFLAPAVLGDRLRNAGMVLMACTPKQVRIGRGAFIQWQTRIVNDRDQVLAIATNTVFRYNPVSGDEQ